MTASAARNSQQRALRQRPKNETHVCGDCAFTVEQHPLGRSAHDRMAAHTATQHGKFLDRECRGSGCRAMVLTSRQRVVAGLGAATSR
jgi:hypothetical protein